MLNCHLLSFDKPILYYDEIALQHALQFVY